MARILAVGNATLDIINRVDHYPLEDEELRALSQQRRMGGNAANTLLMLSQLGHASHFAGTLSDEAECRILLDTFDRHSIDYSGAEHIEGGALPTSYITLNQTNGSRTIVHHRDLPEYPLDAFAKLPLGHYDWIHFEGRNLGAVAEMIARLRRDHPTTPISLEVEKPRTNIEKLFPMADLLLFSADYARHHGYASATQLLESIRASGITATMSCSWGEVGASCCDNQGHITTLPAWRPDYVIDTVGAGDSFNAGMIGALCRGVGAEAALQHAIELAGRTCGQDGLEGLFRT